MASRRIGFYGGSFDPPHFGHLSLAIELAEAHALDEVWWCPARVSPHKEDDHPISAQHRLAMVELAIQEIPHFKLLTIESQRKGPSYTIDTLRELIAHEKKREQSSQLFLMLGDDAVSNFFKWHLPEEIVDLVPLLIGTRSKDSLQIQGSQKICEAILRGITSTHRLEISSTELRQRLKQKLYCGHLIPAKVIDYIYRHGLYS